MSDDPRTVALHEAGHALAGYLTGAPPFEIALAETTQSQRRQEGALGWCHYENREPVERLKRRIRDSLDLRGHVTSELRDNIEAEIVRQYAGLAAQVHQAQLLEPGKDAAIKVPTPTPGDDVHTAEDLASLVCKSERERYFYCQWLCERAVQMIARNWSLIERVAEELERTLYIDRMRFERIVAEHDEDELRRRFGASLPS